MNEFIELYIPNREIAVVREAVLQQLGNRDLYKPDLIYRGFGSHMISSVLQYGSEDPSDRYIYGNNEEALSIDPDPIWENPLSYALYGKALAVYEGSKLISGDYTCYEFLEENKMSSLVIVFSLPTASRATLERELVGRPLTLY